MVLLLPLSLISAACSVAGSAGESADDLGSVQEPEKWSTGDDPGILSSQLSRNIGNLPSQGQASPIPWAGSYWRMSQDSINYRWAGPNTRSAVEKYDAAFGGYRTSDQVSLSFGIDSQMNARPCTADNQCNQSLKEQCGKRAGRSVGRCVPFWFGICNGWSAAALLYPEPAHRVVQSGVTFEVTDIKALLSLLSTTSRAKGISLTCRASDASGGVRYDGAGRPVEPECRDTNPGTFHILLTNYLGIQQKALVEDRTFDDQIWNQPIRGYQVEEARTISAEEANQLIAGRGSSRYLFDADAKQLAYMKTRVYYILEAPSETNGSLSSQIDTYTGQDEYEYVLELDGASAIIGGEWVGDSKRNHPDFLWLPGAGAGTSVAGGAIRYDRVKALVDASIGG